MNKVVSNYEKEYGHLAGKKLLILGGVKLAADIVKRAQNMGIYVVVADYLEDSPAKKIADKAVNLDATNVDQIVEFCQTEHIDGITTGFVDILLKPCHDACSRLGLPYYAPDLLIDMSTNKTAFKGNCRKFGIPVPEDYSFSDVENYIERAETIVYPVFVKPADNSGSRGAFVCKNKEEFLLNYPIALSYSPSKHVIVEQFLTGQDIILDYLIKDGEPFMLSMFDRKMCEGRSVAVNHSNLCMAPSEHLDAFLRDVDPKIVEMCNTLGFRDGLIFFQGYADQGKVTLFEMGCRLGGTFSTIDEAFLGVNPMDALIHYALTGKMADLSDYSKITPQFDGAGAVLNILLKNEPKLIHTINGIEHIRTLPQITNFVQFLFEGDTIPNNNATDRPLLIMYLACKDREELKQTLRTIYDTLEVLDSDGKSMLMPVYFPE